MFDIGWSELLVVAVVALVVVGPRELPGMLRTIGRMMAGVRRMASDFQSQFNEAMREAELDELRKEVDNLKRTATGFLEGGADPMSTARDTLKDAIEGKPDEKNPVVLPASDYDSSLTLPVEEPSILPPAAPAEASGQAPTADGMEALRAFPSSEPAPAPELPAAPEPPAAVAMPAPPAAPEPAPTNGAARP